MYRILFMPLLQIPSGHHHVADSIKDHLDQSPIEFQCEKVELISYSYGTVESFVSTVYLRWIHKLPGIYSYIYKHAATNEKKAGNRFYLYESLFLKKVLLLIEQTKPDLIICTHALPSYLIQCLKRKNHWNGTVINVYTDYFINNLWGFEKIDYHFVPTIHQKNRLTAQGVIPDQIFVTGIPIHPLFTMGKKKTIDQRKLTILISGGNMGAGSIRKLIEQLNPSGAIIYKVLCGKNEFLRHHIENLKSTAIKPLPYIDSKEEMNLLYDEADAIITKPGGVTITECLWKRLPIFVYEALPGQEEINFNYLTDQGLIYRLNYLSPPKNIEQIIIEKLINGRSHFNEHLDKFYNHLEKRDVSEIIGEILEP